MNKREAKMLAAGTELLYRGIMARAAREWEARTVSTCPNCGSRTPLHCPCLDDDEDALELDQAERYRDAVSDSRRFT